MFRLKIKKNLSNFHALDVVGRGNIHNIEMVHSLKRMRYFTGSQ